jgi:hypothetical protein
VEGKHAEETDVEGGDWDDVVLGGVDGLGSISFWLCFGVEENAYSDDEEPHVFGGLWWVDADVLVLEVIEDVLPLGQLPGKDQLTVERQPVILLPAVVVPPWLVAVNTNRAWVIRDNIWVGTSDVCIWVMSETVLVDPEKRAQSSEGLVYSSESSPDYGRFREGGVAAVVAEVEAHHGACPSVEGSCDPRNEAECPRGWFPHHSEVSGYEEDTEKCIGPQHHRRVSWVFAYCLEVCLYPVLHHSVELALLSILRHVRLLEISNVVLAVRLLVVVTDKGKSNFPTKIAYVLKNFCVFFRVQRLVERCGISTDRKQQKVASSWVFVDKLGQVVDFSAYGDPWLLNTVGSLELFDGNLPQWPAIAC